MRKKNKKIFLKMYKNSDILSFANLSKDFNDIHFDNEFTYRSVYGKKIVHGILILLDTLEKLNSDKILFKVKNINCKFLAPIFVGEKIFFLKNFQKNRVSIKIFKENNQVCQYIIFFFSEKKINILNLKKKKLINFKKNIFKKNKYKKRRKIFGVNLIKTLINISYLSGSIIPGNKSILLNIEINLINKDDNKKENNKKIISFNFDKRFRLYQVILKNNFKIISIKHPEFPKQHEIKNLRKKISYKALIHKFKKKKCLIIGGTRGLGELFTKILYIVNARCVCTFYKSKKQLIILKKDFNLKKINFIKHDITKKFFLNESFDYIFYFATPKIESNKKKFNQDLYKKYKLYYNDLFFKLFKFYHNRNKNLKIFFPSTNFLNYKKSSYKEYCLAKKNTEKKVLYERKFNKVNNIFFSRLESQHTDQNLSLFGFQDTKDLKNKSVKIANLILNNI